MKFLAITPKKFPDGTLEWSAKWNRVPLIALVTGTLILLAKIPLGGERPTWFFVLAVTAAVAGGLVIVFGPRQRLSVNFQTRQLKLQGKGWAQSTSVRVIPFDQIREIVIGDVPQKHHTLLVRTAQEDIELPTLGRVYANEQVLAELRSTLSHVAAVPRPEGLR